jgi:hypothetical protein
MPSFDRNKILVAGFTIVAAGVATYLARRELKKMNFEWDDIDGDEYRGYARNLEGIIPPIQ